MPDPDEIREELERLRAAVNRVDAEHRAWHAWTFMPCARHEGPEWRRDIVKCSNCTRGMVSSCVHATCGSWPCATHLTLHDETRLTCTHRPAGETAREAT